MSLQDPQDKSEKTESGTGESGLSVPGPDVTSDREQPREIGGRGGLDPTRFGDWEKAGRCIDF